MKRWIPIAIAVLGLAPSIPGCSGAGAEDANAPARRAVLASVAQNVILPTLRDFDSAMDALVAATEAYAATPGPDTLAAAQQAWIDAMTVWERAEVMQVGPAAMPETPGGQDLRDAIYSWPTTNPCGIDQATVAQTYQDRTVLAAELVSVRGLDAMEYLLFDEDTSNACALTADINANGTWDGLGAAEIQQRRADYAAAIAQNVSDTASQLVSAWEPTGGDFATQLAQAGLDESTVYDTSQQALNAVSDALFYLDTETKDMKVAEPVGIVAVIGCVDPTCPQELESQWAHRSKEHVLENLRGFALVFRGGPGDDPSSEGFDDLLTELGPEGAELATQLNQRIDAAIALIEGTDGTFAELLTTNPQAIRDIHAAIKAITDLLKTQFLALLDLSPPANAPADND